MARPIAREAAMQLIFEQLFGGEGETQEPAAGTEEPAEATEAQEEAGEDA